MPPVASLLGRRRCPCARASLSSFDAEHFCLKLLFRAAGGDGVEGGFRFTGQEGVVVVVRVVSLLWEQGRRGARRSNLLQVPEPQHSRWAVVVLVRNDDGALLPSAVVLSHHDAGRTWNSFPAEKAAS